MLGFITGINSAARRKAMYECVEKSYSPTFIVVPEQFTFESEKMLAEKISGYDSRFLEAVSFTRLCNYIFREYGGIAGSYSDDSTRLILMGAALYQCRDNLEYYTRNIHSTSFMSKLLSADSEIKNAGIEPCDILKISEIAQSDVLKKKAKDLATIFETYNSLLEKSWLDPLTDMKRACEILETNNYFSGKTIIFESFSGFTGIEYRMIEHILRQADAVILNLCTDGFIMDHTDGTGLFSETQKTAERFISIAKRLGVKVIDPLITHPLEEEKSGAICDIERCFLRENEKPSHHNNGEVSLIKAQSPYDEADFVACEIRRLVEGGMRWKDITVVARDISIYEHAVKTAFEKAGIPLFMDRDASVSSHPLASFISSSLSAARKGMDTADIMRIIKSGILPISDEDAGAFENYCYVWNIHGKMFRSEFTNNPSGFSETFDSEAFNLLEKINNVRNIVCVPLAKFIDSTLDSTGSDFAKALYQYLCDCDVTSGLKLLYDKNTENNNISFAESLDSYWNYVIDALDKFSSSLGDMNLGRDIHFQLFDMVIGSAKIGLLPQTLDSVTFGAANRIRMYSPKAVFFIGLCDGIFPQRPSENSLFTENERNEISELGFTLAQGPEEFIMNERMHAFYVFSSPSEKLYLSYFEYNHHFEKMEPSIFIDNIRKSVDELLETSTALLPQQFWLCSKEYSFDRLSSMANESTPCSEAIKKALCEDSVWRTKADLLGKKMKTSSFVINDRNNAIGLFGKNLSFAPTAIEKYSSCPLSYFLTYGLRLKDLTRAEINPLSSGNIIHYVLEKTIKKYGGKGLSSLSDKELKDEIKNVMEEYLDSSLGTISGKNEKFKYKFQKIRQGLFKVLKHVQKEFENSGFEPYAFELKLGNEEIPTYNLSSPDGIKICINGKIDRLDIHRTKNGKLYIRIIDYKSGHKVFNLSDVYYGLNLQMLIYLFAAWGKSGGSLKDSSPAGILYMPAGDKVISVSRANLKEEGEKKENESRRMNGLILDDPEIIEAMDPSKTGLFIPVLESGASTDMLASLSQLGQIKKYIDKTIIEMAGGLHEGKIGANPYKSTDMNACSYCLYVNVCRRNENDKFCEHKDMHSSEFYSLIEEGSDDNG